MIGISQIIFGEYESEKKTYDDWGLLMTGRNIGSPPIKRNLISVPYRDGSLDYTKYNGRAYYDNRTLEFEFKLIDSDRFYITYTEIADYLHGQEMKVVIPEDRSFYYYGMCQISDLDISKALGRITITVDAAPFKYSKASSLSDIPWDDVNFEQTYFRYIGTVTVDNEAIVTIPKGFHPIVPIFNVTQKSSDNFTVQIVLPLGALCYMNLGRNRFPAIQVCGTRDVQLRFRGSGKLTIDYREQRI